MQILIRKFRTLVGLAPTDRVIALATISLVAAVRIALWTLPFRWVKSAVEGCGRVAWVKLTERQIAWAVRLASRYVSRATCLTQALTALMMLHWAGIDGKLHIGVTRVRVFEAHAWVECAGRILVGSSEDADRFTPIMTLERN